MDAPTSSGRKLARGVEQVKTLCDEAAAFENAHAYEFRAERKPRSAQEVEYRCVAIEREPPPDHWAVLAGEAIHNLRGALDHFVYESSGGNRRTQFPIFTDHCEFQVRGIPKLKGVPKAVRARIEAAQPYRRLPDTPTQDGLARLSALSNLDKHRTLATVAAAVQDEWVGGSGAIEIEWPETGLYKVLGAGETYISTITAKGEVDQVNVQPSFGYQVRIEGRPINDLNGIAQLVGWVLAECRGQVFNPFASA